MLAIDDAEENSAEFVRYLLYEKLSEQAADVAIQNYDDTLVAPVCAVGSLRTVDPSRLAKLGYMQMSL